MKIARSFPRIESAVFYLLLAANLIPIWSVHYFLTGDGPCHLYNAKVLLDMYHSAELKAFYNPWLGINYFFEPNWFSHAALEMMMGLGMAPYLAEKLLQNFLRTRFRSRAALPDPADQSGGPFSEQLRAAALLPPCVPDGLL
jgi:hypothetical protein